MQNKQQHMLVVAIIAIVTVGLMTIPSLSKQAFANPEFKAKFYQSEDGSVSAGSGCPKDNGGCQEFKEIVGGDNVNKNARENCESDSGQKCKQIK